MSKEFIVIITLAIIIAICVIAISIVLYNFMLLLSELNKRLIYTISDILQSIDLSTPHIDSLQPEEKVNIEDLLDERDTEGNYFNPHEFDVDKFESDK